MAKYNVGVGDAFPLDENQARPPRDEDRDQRRYERACRRHERWTTYHSNTAFKATFILLAIWAVLEAFTQAGGPNGLLIAAGIVFAVGLANRLFSPRPRRPRRDERRRTEEDR